MRSLALEARVPRSPACVRLHLKYHKKGQAFACPFLWYSRWESNPERPLRRGLLYPFNYGSIFAFSV